MFGFGEHERAAGLEEPPLELFDGGVRLLDPRFIFIGILVKIVLAAL